MFLLALHSVLTQLHVDLHPSEIMLHLVMLLNTKTICHEVHCIKMAGGHEKDPKHLI